jgi:Ca2+/Na+ antiporter
MKSIGVIMKFEERLLWYLILFLIVTVTFSFLVGPFFGLIIGVAAVVGAIRLRRIFGGALMIKREYYVNNIPVLLIILWICFMIGFYLHWIIGLIVLYPAILIYFVIVWFQLSKEEKEAINNYSKKGWF